jgi:hypothetical protein
MIEPDSNQIIKNYYKGTIDLPTARTLLIFIKGYPQFRRRLNSDDMNYLNNLEKDIGQVFFAKSLCHFGYFCTFQ